MTRAVRRPPAELLREQEVAAKLGVHLNTMRRMRARGDGPPPVRLGRLVRYRWGDVAEWMDAQTRVAR